MKIYKVEISCYGNKNAPAEHTKLWNSALGCYTSKEAALAAISEVIHNTRPVIPFTVAGDKSDSSCIYVRPVEWVPPSYRIEILEVKE